MKIRRDFVTNSSSSSFVIGKADENINVDIVFRMIRDIYKEYYALRDAFIPECGKYDMSYVEDEGSTFFKHNKGKLWDKENEKVEKKVEKLFHISGWDRWSAHVEWFNFETYQEYVDYWVKKMTEDKRFHAPFSIVDYANPESYRPIEISLDCTFKSSTDAMKSDVFGWYIPCGEYLFGPKEVFEKFNSEIDSLDERELANHKDYGYLCSYCYLGDGHRITEDFDDDFVEDRKEKEDLVSKRTSSCVALRKAISKGKIDNKNALIKVLGKTCIHSECGYIPDYVVDKLLNMCRFGCNHMG